METKRGIIHSQIGHAKINTDNRHNVKLVPKHEIKEGVKPACLELGYLQGAFQFIPLIQYKKFIVSRTASSH